MTQGKERSSLFKFLYTILSVITFPIFAVLYVLKHPLWVATLLLMAGGLLVYYPMSSGVTLEEVPTWYKNKYTEAKLNVIQTAVEKGHGDMFSEDMLKDLEDEVQEQKGLKSENYNGKISRDEALKEKTVGVKKRGGFKRKGGEDVAKPKADDLAEKAEGKADDGEQIVSGGLEAILREKAAVPAETTTAQPEISEENVPVGLPQPEQNVSEADIQENAKPAEEKPQEKEAAQSGLDEFDLF